MKCIYSQEFKLHVIRTYLESPYGIRTIAKQFDLPSKNYITNWIISLKKEDIFSEEELLLLQAKSTKSNGSKLTIKDVFKMSPSEKQLAEENMRLRAEVEFLKKSIALKRNQYPKR